MATIRAYTTIEQSRKLAEILPLESADMHYHYDNDFDELESIPTITEEDDHFILFPEDVRCWSLAALLSVLPKIDAEEPMVRKLYYASKPIERYICEYGLTNMTSEYDNPVDACVAMIERLHELKML